MLKQCGWIMLLSSVSKAFAGSCENLQNYRALMACIPELSVQLKTQSLELRKNEALLAGALERQNPQVQIQSVYGPTSIKVLYETDLVATQLLELGGKREKRKKLVQEQQKEIQADVRVYQFVVIKDIKLKLHRYRQQSSELLTLAHLFESTKHWISVYQSRPVLSPEQRIYLSMFQNSLSNLEVEKSLLEDERQEIVGAVSRDLGLSLSKAQFEKLLPSAVEQWPSLNTNELHENPEIQSLHAQLQSAQASSNLEEASRFPNVTLGPAVRLQEDDTGYQTYIGFQLNIPLQLWNRNTANRALAKKSLEILSEKKSLQESGMARSLEALQSRYTTLIEHIQRLNSGKSLQNRHEAQEKVFRQGLIPANLIIDSHEIWKQSKQEVLELELRALNVYFEFHRIQGTLTEVGL